MSKTHKPRPLSDDEIEDILSGIERMTYTVKSATQLAQDEVKKLLRKQLSSIELVPEAIPEMKRLIRSQYNRAVIEPQTPVGFLVSEALSQPITQMTLNSVVGESEIVIADKDTKEAKVVHIGEWIDELLKQNKDKIVNIPENRTEYLELEKPVLIPSTTCDGSSEWMELTAVTRHLPVGDLVKIKTESGRGVTATSQKSFLVYDEKQDKLVEKNGKDLKLGDYVGIHLGLENDDVKLLDEYSGRKRNKGGETLFDVSRKYEFAVELWAKMIPPFPVAHTINLNHPDCPYKKWKDIVLDPIVLIESIPSQDRNVYDVTVPKSLNFNLFNGLVMSDTFHQSGSSKNMSSGIDALKELFNVSEERKNYNMNIHFNIRDLEYNQLFDLRTKIVEVKLQDIIKNYEYIPSSQPLPSWTDGYLNLTKQVLPPYEWRLRLFLDVNQMLAYKIPMNRIIKMIRDKAPPNIIVVPSPITLGILDLYPKEDEIDRQFGQNSSLMFLSVSVLPIIQQFLLSGIEGIDALFPTHIPILSIVIEEIPVASDSNEFYLCLSRSQMRKTGIGIPELKKLFDFVSIQIVDETEEGIYVEMPEKSKNAKGYPFPTKYIKELLRKEEIEMDEEEKQMRLKQVRGYMSKCTDFYRASKCWIAETNGKNFLEVIQLPEVDPYYTYSNDFYETSSILGIEATRTLLMMELKNVLVREEYINMRHISLLVDVMTNLGRLTPISFYGAMRFGQGALSLATNQQSMKVFTGSTAFGKRETVDSVSASVMLGKKAKIGTGFIDILTKDKTPIVKDKKKNIENNGCQDLQNEDMVEQQNVESNHAYMKVMFNTCESEIYGNRGITDSPRLKDSTTIPQENKKPPEITQPMVQESKGSTSQQESKGLSLPKKTSMRLNGLADIHQRMKAKKQAVTEEKPMKIQVEDSMNVLNNL